MAHSARRASLAFVAVAALVAFIAMGFAPTAQAAPSSPVGQECGDFFAKAGLGPGVGAGVGVGEKALTRLPVPRTPGGMSPSEFGKVMNWGSGDAAARAQIPYLSKSGLQTHGVTAEMARDWTMFYRNEAMRVPGNPSAAGRADLMNHAWEMLR